MPPTGITVSVVSHRQNALVSELLSDLAVHCPTPLTILVTENVPDAVAIAERPSPHRLERIGNERPRGFGANHNAAFKLCASEYFCVCNPDIRLARDPFPSLVECLESGASAAGPMVRDGSGDVEDSARHFPTPAMLLRKLLQPRQRPEYALDQGPVPVDWIAGMFVLFTAAAYRAVGGFDESYFLYYEDVDMCRRLWRSGQKVFFDPRVHVVHHARRASRRNAAYARHHLASMARYFLRR